MKRISGGLLVLAMIAAACGGGGGDGLTVSVDPESGPPGTVINVTASGCVSDTGGGLFTAAGDETAPIEFTGADQGTLTVPDDAGPGSYEVRVSCAVGAPETEEGVQRTELEVRAADFEVTG
jgi:hypothetical protein